MSETKASELGLHPRARFVSFAVTGVAPEIMGMGPVTAIPKALKLAGLKLADIGLVELNEAFAAQALAVIREAGLDPETLNVNGGAIALGHPLGCTGAKLTATILREMTRRQTRYGMVTMCIGGGQGAAGIFERFHVSYRCAAANFFSNRRPRSRCSLRKTSPKSTAPSPRPRRNSGIRRSRRTLTKSSISSSTF